MDKNGIKTRITLLIKTIDKEISANFLNSDVIVNHFKVLNEYHRELRTTFKDLFGYEYDTEKINKLAQDGLECRINYNLIKDRFEKFLKSAAYYED